MVKWIKKFIRHYVLYCALLLVLCLGIFPFVILFTSSMTAARLLDRFSRDQTHAHRLDGLWTALGRPYDYLVNAVD